jgi:predicted peroxiredoxin
MLFTYFYEIAQNKAQKKLVDRHQTRRACALTLFRSNGVKIFFCQLSLVLRRVRREQRTCKVKISANQEK